MSFFHALVECTPGRYYKDGECIKCDFGTYQDEIGQLSCKECPEGTTTLGRDSRSVNECSLHLDEKSNGIYKNSFLMHSRQKYKNDSYILHEYLLTL